MNQHEQHEIYTQQTLWITLWKRELILILVKGRGGDGASVIKGEGCCLLCALELWSLRWSRNGLRQMHEIQMALAESDAKMEVLQKYNLQCTHAQLDLSDGDDEDERASTALNLDLAEGPTLDSLCKALNQQASVTDYLVKTHKHLTD